MKTTKLTAGQLKAIEVLYEIARPLLLPHTSDHFQWWNKCKPASIQSFNSLRALSLAERNDSMFWTLTDKGKQTYHEIFLSGAPSYVKGKFEEYKEFLNKHFSQTGTCGHEFGVGVTCATRIVGDKPCQSQIICPSCWTLWKNQGWGVCPEAEDLSTNFLPEEEVSKLPKLRMAPLPREVIQVLTPQPETYSNSVVYEVTFIDVDGSTFKDSFTVTSFENALVAARAMYPGTTIKSISA